MLSCPLQSNYKELCAAFLAVIMGFLALGNCDLLWHNSLSCTMYSLNERGAMWQSTTWDEIL